MLLAAIGMVAGIATVHLSNDNLVFVFGALHAVLASISFLVFLIVFGLEIGICCVVEPLCRPRLQGSVPRSWSRYSTGLLYGVSNRILRRRNDSVEMVDVESGSDPRPQYPWNPNGSPTIGFLYREPQLIVTETGLPDDWDRPDNVQQTMRALVEMQAEGVIGVTREDTENQDRASRGTQTNMLDGGRFARDERMPGDMAPMRFWWLLLEEQRQQELASVERENWRWSW